MEKHTPKPHFLISYNIHVKADHNNVFGNFIAANNMTGVWIVALSDHNSITGNIITNNAKAFISRVHIVTA